MSPTLEESYMRTEVVDRIKSVVKDLWPDAQVSQFLNFAFGYLAALHRQIWSKISLKQNPKEK